MTIHSKSALSIRFAMRIEGVLNLHPETGLDEGTSEFAGDGVTALAHDGVQRLRQRKTG